MEKEYGKSDHYIGAKGESYFEYQNQHAALGAKLNALKFAPYLTSKDRVLDFGCGGGWMLNELPGSKKVGVELNQAAHAACRESGITVYSTVAEVAEEKFDKILSHHCLEHVPYPVEALRSLKALLKADGELLIVVPIDDWRVQTDATGRDIDHHLHTWTPRLFANTLGEAGFVVLEMKVLTHAWFPKWELFYQRVPDFVFHAGCTLWGVLRKRRQLFARAVPAADLPLR